MKTYKILVHDRRCPEPIFLTAEMRHDQRACEYARERLRSSADYDAIEVWRAEVRLCQVVSPAVPERRAA